MFVTMQQILPNNTKIKRVINLDHVITMTVMERKFDGKSFVDVRLTDINRDTHHGIIPEFEFRNIAQNTGLFIDSIINREEFGNER